MVGNKQVVLKAYVEGGFLKESDFEVKSSSIEIPNDGSKALLLKNLYLSCDPYLRQRMYPSGNIFTSVLAPFPPASVIMGHGVSKVIKSGNKEFKEGDYVWGFIGWEEYSIVNNPEDHLLIKIQDTTNVPLSYYAGILGMAGTAAYYGFYNICSPKKGEIVYVSSAAGGIGQLAGQFAKLAGCYVVGSAGTDEKVHLLESKLGYDKAFNYKDGPDLASTLKRHFPKGIDIYFDNVGGEMLNEVLPLMNGHGRISGSGMISQYNLTRHHPIQNLFYIIINRIKFQGFVNLDFQCQIYPEYLEWAMKNLSEQKLTYIEDIAEGLQNAPSALVGIFHGKNLGKQLIRIAEEE